MTAQATKLGTDLAHDLARSLDPVVLATDAGFVLDDWQAEALRSTAPRMLMLCSRQSGKTLTTALIALATAILQPGALVLIVSPSQRQSAEMFRTVLDLYHKLEGVPGLVQESVLRSELANGSRIVALPGSEKTVRGYAAAALVIVDEAARVEDALITAVRPMLATSNGRLCALTTPAGKRGWFYEAWTGAENWHRVRVSATECPRISAEFLEEERRALGPLRFSEEYELAWLDDALSVFSTELIDQAVSSDVEVLHV